MLGALIQGSTTASLGFDAGSEFYAGYVWGVKHEDKRPTITSCFTYDSDLNTMLDTIMADIGEGKTEDADKLWEKADPHFNVALQKCSKESVYDEYKNLDKFTKDALNAKDAQKKI